MQPALLVLLLSVLLLLLLLWMVLVQKWAPKVLWVVVSLMLGWAPAVMLGLQPPAVQATATCAPLGHTAQALIQRCWVLHGPAWGLPAPPAAVWQPRGPGHLDMPSLHPESPWNLLMTASKAGGTAAPYTREKHNPAHVLILNLFTRLTV
jgi:hypothetical protein